jgi:hypothetical protein
VRNEAAGLPRSETGCILGGCWKSPYQWREIIQTGPPRFFLPFEHHLQTINEAPISDYAAAETWV